MTVIGLVHFTSIALPPAAPQSPAAILISRLSEKYPTQTHESYHFDHRLFVSSSSLPPLDASTRTYTHLFTSSHTPQKTFVGTTPSTSTSEPSDTKTDKYFSVITVPTASSLEPFTALLVQKFGLLWASRQFVVTENGTSMILPIRDNARWRISIADLRVSPSRANGPTVGQPRGVVLEIQCQGGSYASNTLDTQADKDKYENYFRKLLQALFGETEIDLKLDKAKIHLAVAADTNVVATVEDQKGLQAESTQSLQHTPAGHEIPELYMEVLRGPRG